MFKFKKKKICVGGKDPSELGILVLLRSGGLLEYDVPTLALHRINGDSAGNHHLIDEVYTGGMVIPPGVTRSQTRNTPEECSFPLGITRSETRNPPEEWDSAGNYRLVDEESNRGKGFHRELPAFLR
jgi:hypothetical protein